jgi:hypothetical protein
LKYTKTPIMCQGFVKIFLARSLNAWTYLSRQPCHAGARADLYRRYVHIVARPNVWKLPTIRTRLPIHRLNVAPILGSLHCFVVRTSTALASAGRSPLRSYGASMRIHCLPDSMYVLGCVEISIMGDITFWTGPGSNATT